jgi:hypothetical protein
MTLQPAFVGIPLAFNYVYPLTYIQSIGTSGTPARIKACLETLKQLDPRHKYSMVIFTANKPRNNDQETRVMCVQQTTITSILTRRIPILAEPTGWGTESEIISAIEIARRELRDRDVTLVVSTNWAHMCRVRLLVSMHKPKHWKCVFATAKHHFSAYSYLREIPATLITLGRWFFIKHIV